MKRWVAVAFGALDIRSHSLGEGVYEYVVTPARPAPPLFLVADGAALWRRLVDGPLSMDDLDRDSIDILLEMEAMGIASSDIDDDARVTAVAPPTLSSPFHELVYALVGSVCRQSSIRALFIKGPTLHAQGLRSREHSGDVDCWVPPGEERRLARALQQWGWTPAYSAFSGTAVLHSLTLRAGSWGCAIDVHSWFPGITLEAAEAFDLVERSSTDAAFAGKLVVVPSRPVHAMISALHDTRPLLGVSASVSKVEQAAGTLRRAGSGVPQVVHEFQAGYALRDVMRTAFPDDTTDWGGAPIPPDWEWRQQRSTPRIYLAALRLIPWRRRPSVVAQLLWSRIRSVAGR